MISCFPGTTTRTDICEKLFFPKGFLHGRDVWTLNDEVNEENVGTYYIARKLVSQTAMRWMYIA